MIEPARPRIVLILGKFPIVRVAEGGMGLQIALQLPGVKLICTVPKHADVKEGDILSLYTEVLSHARH